MTNTDAKIMREAGEPIAKESEMKTINVRYGIGYGTHTLDFEVEDRSTPEQIEDDVRMAVEERLWWSYEVDGVRQ